MTEINTKSQLAKMLMRRDKLTLKEAKYHIAVAQQLINEALEACDYEYAEDILNDNLGIELDYIYLFI